MWSSPAARVIGNGTTPRRPSRPPYAVCWGIWAMPSWSLAGSGRRTSESWTTTRLRRISTTWNVGSIQRSVRCPCGSWGANGERMNRWLVFLFVGLVGCAPKVYYRTEIVKENLKCNHQHSSNLMPPDGYELSDLQFQDCWVGDGCTTCWAKSKVVKVPALVQDCPECVR